MALETREGAFEHLFIAGGFAGLFRRQIFCQMIGGRDPPTRLAQSLSKSRLHTLIRQGNGAIATDARHTPAIGTNGTLQKVFPDLSLQQALDPKPPEDRVDGFHHRCACRQARFALAACGQAASFCRACCTRSCQWACAARVAAGEWTTRRRSC